MNNQTIHIQPWNDKRKYCVKHKITVHDNGNEKKSEVTFDILLSCLPATHQNNFIWKVERENFLLNDELPESPHMQMFIGAEESIYPLLLEISDQGKFLGIDDFFNWKNETFNQLEKVKSQFEGFYAEDFITRFQEEIQSEAKLKKKLNGQAFFKLFVFDLFEEKTEETIEWNILKIGNFTFKGSTTSEKIEEKLTQTLFECLNTIDPFIHNDQKINDIKSSFQIKNIFNPYSGYVEKKVCHVMLNSKESKFFYEEKIEMEFLGLRIGKNIPMQKEKQGSFFLSEKEEIKNI